MFHGTNRLEFFRIMLRNIIITNGRSESSVQVFRCRPQFSSCAPRSASWHLSHNEALQGLTLIRAKHQTN